MYTKCLFLVKVPLAGCLHQWNTVTFLLLWPVRLMKDPVIRGSTLSVSRSNEMIVLQLPGGGGGGGA